MIEAAYQAQIIQWLFNDSSRMEILQIAARFCEKNKLTDWCLAAGFIRNLVWDHLHHYVDATALNDVDLIYFNSTNAYEDADLKFEQELKQQFDINWSVKNQARMHWRNDDLPYQNIRDAISYWPEVETALGVYLWQRELKIIAPFGLKSLLEGKISLNPKPPKPEIFQQRVEEKKWLQHWPNLEVLTQIPPFNAHLMQGKPL